MYQDLSFMKVPLPEDVLKLKIYGDYAGEIGRASCRERV
mgnify:CR=1 FL=1